VSFFNICRERKQFGGACCMNIPANVLCVFIRESIQVLALHFFVNQAAWSFTQVPHCFFFKQNYLIFADLSRLHCHHHDWATLPPPPPKKNVWTFIALYVAFIFFITTTPSFRSVLSARFLETGLEALNDKKIFPFFTSCHFINFHWLHLHSSSVAHNCCEI
jgi:hypothetical protein